MRSQFLRGASPAIAPAAPKPSMPIARPAPAPKPTTSIAPAPAAPKIPAPAPLPFTAPKPASPLPFATARPASPPAPAAGPPPTGEIVVAAIEAVSGQWPDPVRQEIEQFHLKTASISIPIKRLDPGMKAGRVVFPWAELCGWLSVPVPRSAHGDSQVELPLNVMAPLFLAKLRGGIIRKVVAVGGDMPDLFAGPGQTALPLPSAPTPAPMPSALGKLFGQPSKTDWTPEEIVAQIQALSGIAGALLASSDGLLVAGQMPAPLKGETMAAFAPQIFTRAGGCAEEAKLGTLRAVKLLAGQAPCAIFKAGALYLAVLGLAGQTLPEPALERIAGELARLKH
jgi:predicted regulator of Ras-like GTPase activity (Roadblock/LC7/MglB family)